MTNAGENPNWIAEGTSYWKRLFNSEFLRQKDRVLTESLESF